jgi:purine nucleosidase
VRSASQEVVERYGVGLSPAPGYAAAAIARHVMDNPGEITIVAIGPLTNIAAAIALEPRLAGTVKEIVIMGGIFLGTMPNRDMPGEFNIWVDPEAAAAVLRCGAPLRFVGLDVTLQVRLTREHAAQMTSSTGEFSQLAGESSIAWIDYLHERNPGDIDSIDSCAMHDPLAVAALTRPDLLTWQDAAVEVVTGDGIARGVMITDLRYGAEPPQANCRIATAVDAAGFMDYFLAAVTRL